MYNYGIKTLKDHILIKGVYTLSTDPGIFSLGGYAYQIKIFISLLPHIQENDTVEFETLDDIAISESNIDSMSEHLCTTKNDLKNSSYTAIQVKKTKITKASLKKIWYNWLLAYHAHGNLNSFELRYAKSLNPSFDLYLLSSDNLFKTISNSTAKKNSLEAKVKQLYKEQKNFESDFTYIKEHSKGIAVENIEQQIHDDYKPIFHWTDELKETYKLRVEEVCRMIQNLILTAVESKQHYICSYNDFYNIVENVTNRITREAYIPDYALFSSKVKLTLENENITSSREFKQLYACNILENSIRIYLTNQQYYNDYRYRSLSNLKANKIENTEITAYENFANVVEKLKHQNNDNPFNRLDLTTSQTNIHAPDEQIKKGVCIHLTEEGIEDSKQISWSDEID